MEKKFSVMLWLHRVFPQIRQPFTWNPRHPASKGMMDHLKLLKMLFPLCAVSLRTAVTFPINTLRRCWSSPTSLGERGNGLRWRGGRHSPICNPGWVLGGFETHIQPTNHRQWNSMHPQPAQEGKQSSSPAAKAIVLTTTSRNRIFS